MSEIIKYDFEGDELLLVRLPDGSGGALLRRLCDSVGVDFDAQRRRLARAAEAGAKWATVVVMTTVAEDGREREMLVLPIRAIPMWAATIDAGRVKTDEAKTKLVRYQDKAADVLARVFVDQAPDHFVVTFPASTKIDPTEALKTLVCLALDRGKLGCAVAHLNAARGMGLGAPIQLSIQYANGAAHPEAGR